ncbi:MAG: cupin [Myxococcales bacterium]|nr:cupin [Myxococcales bacterium]MCB9666144.1 cupin [Alphaproteobacteria bacterium]
MSRLSIHAVADPGRVVAESVDGDEIARKLGGIGVRFERWATRSLPPSAEPDAILARYAKDVRRLQAEGGYTAADVIRLRPDSPDGRALRDRFLAEHTHAEDEVRFFVEGQGLFFLHTRGHVYRVLCEAGDLLSVPALMTHWFDTGPEPHLTAIRLFSNPRGWIADYTGSDIAERFPLLS